VRNRSYRGIGTDTGGQGPTALAFDGENVWVASNWINMVIMLNTDGEILKEITVGEWPSGLVFDGESIWVSNFVDNTVTRLALDGEEIVTLPVGRGPVSMVAVPASPGKPAALWVVNTSETMVSKITMP
jgi:DNA-binding beta-propeller fold protein YncE